MKHPAAWGAAGVVALATPVVAYFEGIKLAAYRDPIGVVTDCLGHTRTAKMGEKSSIAGCARKFREDLVTHWEGIRGCTPGVEHVSDEEWAAYLSFAYNVGVGNFCKSTLATKLKAGDRSGACAELSRWVRAGDEVLPGLVKRRDAERELCELGLPDRLPKGTIG